MNHIKLQTELLKMAEKRDGWKHGTWNVPYFEHDDRIWVCPDAGWGMGIPKSRFYLDADKVFRNQLPFNGKPIVEQANYAEIAEDTNMVIQVTIDRKKLNVHKFTIKDEEIYINENFLKYFDSAPTFKGINNRSPLYVYEFDEVVGLILPVNNKMIHLKK